MATPARAIATSALLLLGVLSSGLVGCGRQLSSSLAPNQPPELEILDARADRGDPTRVRLRWAAHDPDGSVARCCWTVSPLRPGGSGASLNSTTGRECYVPRTISPPSRAAGATHPEPDLLTLWAVDDRGAESERSTIAMFGTNVAPTVVITCPRPSAIGTALMSSQVRISWTGIDPDGIFHQQPVKYRYKVLRAGDPEFDINIAKFDPDSLRRFYAARNWAGWDSTGTDTTSVTYVNLTLNQEYLFIVTGIDEMGDYDPVFSMSKNILDFVVGSASTLGPALTVSNSSYTYTQPSGQISGDLVAPRTAEVPAGVPVTFDVSGQTQVGGSITGYRWALDIKDPSDETPRSGPGDLAHWSDWSLTSRIEPGTFTPIGNKRQEHVLYVEGRSVPAGCTGETAIPLPSLLGVRFVVVSPTRSRELLIVDDTRRQVDQFQANGSLRPYTGLWPSTTELDTFLYARGNVPWRGTFNPPTGAISAPGLFAGYAFDTISTRGRLTGEVDEFGQQSATIPLSVLADYRHVIWMTDLTAANSVGAPTSLINPMSALRYFSSPNQRSPLAAYVAMGGKVWLLGGAAGYASLVDFNARGSRYNDGKYGTGMTVFSADASANELAPGRIMYDAAHVRSEFVAGPSATVLNRALGRFQASPGAFDAFPASLLSKSPGTDPLPPTRNSSQGSQFYQTSHTVEFLTQPNAVLENVSSNPNIVDEQSTLDSFYVAVGALLPVTGNPAVAMTRYHGADNAEFVWTGFDIWSYQRSQCIAVVDAVLQGIWGLPRGPVTRAPAAPPLAIRPR